MQGRIAGLVINNTNGSSSGSQITIHGFNDFQGAFTGKTGINNIDPLVIMDGVAVSANTLNTFNANDFESVTVLKDAASTSIYGARAANGVILITTKKGRRNERV
ncbi:hypothetical protein RCZ04_07610 [Capnocytophaga sp. HP1101]